MADKKLDKELDELEELYRQKIEAQKSSKPAKKVKSEKADSPEKVDKVKKTDKTENLKNSTKKKLSSKKSEMSNEEKLAHKINVGVCASLFAVAAVCLLVLPRPTISESEKRELAKFPAFSWEEYWKGDYTEDISYYFNDTVPMRDELKQLAANFRTLFGFSLNGATIVGDVNIIDQNSSQTEVTTQSTPPIIIVTPPPATDDSSVPTPENSDNTSDNSSSVPAPIESESNNSSNSPENNDTPSHQDQFVTPSDPYAEIVYEQGNHVVYNSNGTLYAGLLYNGNRQYAADYASSLNYLKTQLGDINVYSMTALTQNTFITPMELNRNTYTEQADAMYLRNLINSDIKVIDTLGVLAPHKDEDIFFLRDYHWTQLGAHYIAEAFSKAAGVPFAELSDYEMGEKDCLGSVYINTGYEGLMYEGETFNYYIPPNDYRTEYYNSAYEFQFDYPLMPVTDYTASGFYNLFMVADSYIKHITTDVDNGRVLVMLKDDYPSAMVPSLTSSFEEIYVIDLRYCDFNIIDFCKEKGATDVFVGMTTESALSEFGTYLSYVCNL